MDDQKEAQTTNSSTPTPSSNQNLILGIVMGAVVLLLLLLVITQQFGNQEDSSVDPEVAKMEKELAEMRAKTAMMATTLPNNQTANLLVDEIKRDVTTLGSILEKHGRDQLELQDARSTIQSLSRRLADLQQENDLNKDAAARVLGLEAQVQSLRNQLDGSVDKGMVDSLRTQLAASRAETQELQKELAALREKSAGMIDSGRLAAVRTELDQCLAENNRLRLELQALRTKLDGARLFVTRDNLNPRAQKLFRELERLEGTDRAGLEVAYERIEKDFKARVVESARFATGSADLKKEHEAHIKGVTVEADPNSFFLVVGYASKTGDVKSNRDLSERRSKRVAATVNYLKQTNQDVQAVYLGETARFSKQAAPNQVCEVWEIRP